jgi:hypothetical protein
LHLDSNVLCSKSVAIKDWIGSYDSRSEDTLRHWRVSLGSFTCSVIDTVTQVLGLSSHQQQLPSYALKPSVWRESKGYQSFKSLVVTGLRDRTHDLQLRKRTLSLSTTELPGCGLHC